MKISKLTKITGAPNHTYPELSVARATLVLFLVTCLSHKQIQLVKFPGEFPDNIQDTVTFDVV